MQELSGDSTSNASSPKPTPTDHKSETTRGRGRPVSENVRIPWQVLELTAASGGGPTGGSVMNVEDPNRSEALRGLVSHKRKLSNESDISPRFLPPTHFPRMVLPQPVSPPKSPAQQEAQDELPASGNAVDFSSDVAAQENTKMEPPSSAAVSDKEKEKESFETTEKKIIEEEPSDVAGEKRGVESSAAEKTDGGNGHKKMLFDLNELPEVEEQDMP